MAPFFFTLAFSSSIFGVWGSIWGEERGKNSRLSAERGKKKLWGLAAVRGDGSRGMYVVPEPEMGEGMNGSSTMSEAVFCRYGLNCAVVCCVELAGWVGWKCGWRRLDEEKKRR